MGLLPDTSNCGLRMRREWRGKRSQHSRRMRNPQFAYLVRGPWWSICSIVQQGKNLLSLLYISVHDSVMRIDEHVQCEKSMETSSKKSTIAPSLIYVKQSD